MGVFFGKIIVKLVGWRSFTRGINQTWPEVKEERRSWDSPIEACCNLLSKYGDFTPFFPHDVAIWAHFSAHDSKLWRLCSTNLTKWVKLLLW
jgi:hypothetical protein